MTVIDQRSWLEGGDGKKFENLVRLSVTGQQLTSGCREVPFHTQKFKNGPGETRR